MLPPSKGGSNVPKYFGECNMIFRELPKCFRLIPLDYDDVEESVLSKLACFYKIVGRRRQC